MRLGLSQVSLAACVSVVMAACGSFSPIPTPPRICETATICTEIITTNDILCSDLSERLTNKEFRLLNNHPDRKIYVTYEEYVRHINSVQKDEKAVKMVSIDPGRTAVLGCWRTKGALSEQFDEWSYTVPTACFANECPAPPINKPADTRDPKASCERLCEQDDANCFKTEIQVRSEIEGEMQSSLSKLTRSLLNSNPPTRVSVDPLVRLSNLFSNTNSCWRSDLLIGKADPISSSFSNSGSTCRVGFEVQDPRITSLEISFQGDWLGRMEKLGGTYTLAAVDDTHAPLMSILKRGGSREYESIIKITGHQGVITFTGAKYYCAQINWFDD